jgi:aldehyde dehydrogenase (NAD+)
METPKKLKYDSVEEIRSKINILREANKKQKLHDISYRKKQLNILRAAILKYEKEIHESNKIDLNHSEFNSVLTSSNMVIQDINYTLSHIDSWTAKRSVDVPIMFAPGKSYIVPEPYGVCLVMASWNFQYSTLLQPVAQAISAGNCVLAKPSEMATESAYVCQKILGELDPDIVQVVQGDAPQCIELLKNQFDIILFTGSPMKGRLIAEAAAKFLTPCILELGGQNPTIVDSNCNMKNAAYNIVNGRFMQCGQVCLSPEYVLIDSKIHKEFIEILKQTTNEFFNGNAQTSKDYNRIINEFHTKRIADLIENCPKENLICGGKFDIKDRYVEPTIFSFDSISAFKDINLSKDEIFGPIMYTAPYNNIEECIEYINSKDKPLALYYFGSNSENKKLIEKRTSSGSFVCNDAVVHFTSHYLPFGGVGKSGMSAYHGKFGFDNLSHLKPVLDRKEMLMTLRYPPYTEGKQKIMRFAMGNLNTTQGKIAHSIVMMVALASLYFMYPTLKNFLIR